MARDETAQRIEDLLHGADAEAVLVAEGADGGLGHLRVRHHQHSDPFHGHLGRGREGEKEGGGESEKGRKRSEVLKATPRARGFLPPSGVARG